MSNKTALITGISGYIGSNLARTLVQSGWKVAGIVRPDSDLRLLADIQDQLLLCQYDGTVNSLSNFMGNVKPDTVFHLASCFIAEHKPEQITSLIQSNILFGTHLLETMARFGIKQLVNTGTSWQHYNNEAYNPVCLYAATKEAFTKIIKFYVEAHGFMVITLELFDTYGPNDPRKKLINLFFENAKSSQQLNMSPGEQEIDLVYIEDVIAAFLQAQTLLFTKQTKPLNACYMVTTGKPLKLKNIAKIFEQVFQTQLKIQWGGREYRNREVMQVWNQGVVLPGWCATIDLKQGLLRLRELSND